MKFKLKNYVSNFESINKIEPYEIDDEEVKGLRSEEVLIISEHWNIRGMVVLEFNKKKITVAAEELTKAITNAQNAHCY